MPTTEEVLLPFPGPVDRIPIAKHLRSNWIIQSRRILRERAYLERYEAALSPADRDAIAQLVAATWTPMSIAVAHYRACQALGLPRDEVVEMGRVSAQRNLATGLGVAARLVSSGATWWTVLAQFQRIYDRGFDGGAVATWKIGPKDARMEMVGNAMAGLPYFIAGMEGVMSAVGELFSHKLYVRAVKKTATETSITFRFSWV